MVRYSPFGIRSALFGIRSSLFAFRSSLSGFQRKTEEFIRVSAEAVVRLVTSQSRQGALMVARGLFTTAAFANNNA
jgi:hypothetical protein